MGILLQGCSLIPKPVEFFQKKVQSFPERSETLIERQREAAALTAVKARETKAAALAEGASDSVVRPATQTETLAGSVSLSLGPPLNPYVGSVESLAAKLDTVVAKFDREVRRFDDKNEAVEGKKIEGTGLFSVPYFLWVALIGGVVFVVFVILRTLLKGLEIMHPGVGVGMGVARMVAAPIKDEFETIARQVLKGGEEFKNAVKNEVDDPDLQQKILTLFRIHQERKQSPETQKAIRELTHPE